MGASNGGIGAGAHIGASGPSDEPRSSASLFPAAASAHSRPSRAVRRNLRAGEPAVAGIGFGRAEHQAMALVGVVLVGIAIREDQDRRGRVLRP